MEYYIIELGNGIRGVLKQVKSPVVYSAITIGAGSCDENSDEFGAAHFMEHMFFKGTKKRRQYHINSLLDNVGGELNAYTTKEETVVHSSVLKKDFLKAVDLMSDVVFNSMVDAKELEKEREVIIDEINSYKDSPSELIFDNFEDLIFEGTSLGHPILGSRSSLKKITSSTLHNFTKRCYSSDKIIFSVIGNISPLRFQQTMERYFSSIASSSQNYDRQKATIYTPKHIEKKLSTHQCHMLMGTTAYTHTDSRRLSLLFLTNMLGGQSPSSLLNQELREKRGLTYNVECNFNSFENNGLFSIYFSCDKEKRSLCNDLIEKEIKKLQKGAISEHALSRFKKQLIGQIAIASDNNENLMLSSARSLLTFGEIDSFNTIQTRIEQISSSDILDISNEIMDLNNFSTLTYL
ncbi:MAG: pitrilysin family protein [Rikenellaceae bacterium]